MRATFCIFVSILIGAGTQLAMAQSSGGGSGGGAAAGGSGGSAGSGAGGAGTAGNVGTTQLPSTGAELRTPLAPRQPSVYPIPSGLPPMNSGVTPGGGPVGINPGVRTPAPPTGPSTPQPGIANPGALYSPVVPGTQAAGTSSVTGATSVLPNGVNQEPVQDTALNPVPGAEAAVPGGQAKPRLGPFVGNNFPAEVQGALSQLYVGLMEGIPVLSAFNDEQARELGLVPPSRLGAGVAPYAPQLGSITTTNRVGAVIDRATLHDLLILESDMQRTFSELVAANNALALANRAGANPNGGTNALPRIPNQQLPPGSITARGGRRSPMNLAPPTPAGREVVPARR